MIVTIGTSVISMDKFESAIIKHVKEKQKVLVSNGFLGLWPIYETKEITTAYKLEICYIRGLKGYTFSSISEDHPLLQEQIKSLVRQIKGYDNDAITKAMEDALLGGSDGSNSN